MKDTVKTCAIGLELHCREKRVWSLGVRF